MNNTINFIVTLFGGWLGIHKFAQGKTGMGFLYLFTMGLFGIGWIVDCIIALNALIKNKPVPMKSSPQNQDAYINSLYAEMNQQAVNHAAVRVYIDKYYKGMEEIEAMWSVMYNLKIVSGEQADIFINKCYENLADLQNMLQAERKYGFGGEMPFRVPAYVRLAMLYEKQENYEKAINICVEAIRAGATNDGNKGKMYGRLARLIRKSGITVSDDILLLTNEKR